MKTNYRTMNLLEFQSEFSNETQCRDHLFKMRWPNGFVCPRCGHGKFYDLPRRKLYQCKSCSYQSSVTAGTVMHKTRTPLMKWFWAIFLMAQDKRGISATQLRKQLSLSQYTAWTMKHKIRSAMKERDGHYQLAGLIEIDDSFFGGPDEGGKRGRGTDKTTVLIEVATHDEAMSFARMEVVDGVYKEEIKRVVKKDIKGNQIVRSDGYASYGVLEELGHDHKPEVVKGKKAHLVLKWVHILASNAKAFIKGTYHGKYEEKHLQRYLDEFCYRLNRRKWQDEIFERLLNACVTSKGITYSELTR